MLRWRKPLFIVFLVSVASSGAMPPVESAEAGRPSLQELAAPEPLSPAEEAHPAVAALAGKFNPTMAFPTRDIWPTTVNFSWHDGPVLMARVIAKTGKVISEYLALAGDSLDGEWGDLPLRTQEGHRIAYYVDAPGDDRIEDGESGWLKRWRAIMAREFDDDDVSDAAYPPTQYAHVFWFNRAKGLLGIQYWFYYPYNSWINRHEGDWEHVNVIVAGPKTLDAGPEFKPVGVQYFFHGQVYEPEKLIYSTDAQGGFHPLVFTGGSGRFLMWSGNFSGGSYPYPAQFAKAGHGLGPLAPSDDTRNPKRFISAADFDVVLLPEPQRLDTERRPELSWLRLPFFAGQWKVYGNPFLIEWLGRGGPPPQPGLRPDWNAKRAKPVWKSTWKIQRAPLAPPPGLDIAIADLAAAQESRSVAGKRRARRPAALDARRYLPTDWH